MKTIVLHGSLRDHLPAEYDGRFRCDFSTAREAVSAINANFAGFFDKIRTMLLHVVAGDAKQSLNETQAYRDVIVADELHIYPALEGAGGGKGLFAILGIALIAVAAVMTGGAALMMAGNLGGAMSALGGASGLAGFALNMGVGLVLSALVQPPDMALNGDDKPGLKSAIYSGPLNTQQEGVALPYVAGREVLVGGVVIHTDLQIETIVNGTDDD